MSADRVTEPAARRKFWGWGREDEGLTASEVDQLGRTFAKQFGIQDMHPQEPPRVDQLTCRPRSSRRRPRSERPSARTRTSVRLTPTAGHFVI